MGTSIDNNGAQFYDRATPAPYKSQLYVHFTNHNFFNREWLFDDGVGHRSCRGPSMSACSRSTAAPSSARACWAPRQHAFSTATSGPPACSARMSISRSNGPSSRWTTMRTSTRSRRTRSGPTRQSAGMNADEFPFAQVAGAFNASFYGESVGMVVPPGRPGARSGRAPPAATFAVRDLGPGR